MKVLCACEESQRVCLAFRHKGHEAYSCDLIDESGGHPDYHIKQDVLPLLQKNARFFTQDGIYHAVDQWDMIIAFPPCTHLCITGNRWFTEGRKPYSLRLQAIAFFYRFVMADCDKIAIENPVSIMSTAYRKPDQIIQPYMFGHETSKKTCLWLKNLPCLKPTQVVIPKSSYSIDNFRDKNGKILAWNSQEIKTLRSKTFLGIAAAMADQWG